jgi:putative flippase GtrA
MSSHVEARSASALPVRKVAAGGAAGAVTVILVWIASAAFKVDIPPEVASAITVVISFVAGYLIPPAPGEVVVTPAPAQPVATGTPR